MIRAERQQPDTGRVFDLKGGEKIRIEYSNINIYKSSGNYTVVEIGWGDNKETQILDIKFEDFDGLYEQNKKDWKTYYNWNSSY